MTLIEMAVAASVDAALGELQRQCGGTLDDRMLLEARSTGLFAAQPFVAHAAIPERVPTEVLEACAKDFEQGSDSPLSAKDYLISRRHLAVYQELIERRKRA